MKWNLFPECLLNFLWNLYIPLCLGKFRISHPEVFLGKGVLKIYSKFTGEQPCRSVLYNFIEIALRHDCSPVNLLHISEHFFPRNTSGSLLLLKNVQTNGAHIPRKWIFSYTIYCTFTYAHPPSLVKTPPPSSIRKFKDDLDN